MCYNEELSLSSHWVGGAGSSPNHLSRLRPLAFRPTSFKVFTHLGKWGTPSEAAPTSPSWPSPLGPTPLPSSPLSATPDTLYSFFSTADSIASDNLPNVIAYDVGDGVPEGYVLVGKPQEDIELFLRAAPANFSKGMEKAVAKTGRRVSCLVTDAFFWFGADMAAEMELPWVAFWTAGPASLSVHLYTDHIRQTLGAGQGTDGREDETLQFIPGMSKVRIRDLPEGVVFGNLDSLFSRMLCDVGRGLPRAAAVFLNSFEELDPTITAETQRGRHREPYGAKLEAPRQFQE